MVKPQSVCERWILKHGQVEFFPSPVGKQLTDH